MLINFLVIVKIIESAENCVEDKAVKNLIETVFIISEEAPIRKDGINLKNKRDNVLNLLRLEQMNILYMNENVNDKTI